MLTIKLSGHDLDISGPDGAFGAPIPLSGPHGLPSSTITAIKTIIGAAGSTARVFVLGGPDGISQADVDVLLAAFPANAQPHVVRIAGADRFDTAAQLATLAASRPGMTGRATYLANGIASGADALSVGPLTGAGAATVLTAPSTGLPTADATDLAGNDSRTAVAALGLPGTIPDAVLAAAQATIG